jgi:hypothetical protein
MVTPRQTSSIDDHSAGEVRDGSGHSIRPVGRKERTATFLTSNLVSPRIQGDSPTTGLGQRLKTRRSC